MSRRDPDQADQAVDDYVDHRGPKHQYQPHAFAEIAVCVKEGSRPGQPKREQRKARQHEADTCGRAVCADIHSKKSGHKDEHYRGMGEQDPRSE
ncbi:hypothetical protein GCM10023176_10730 [Micromonospora coerulea]|uniref:Uncharacterized protein n=1 Tax=Micromonospora coerulea TaxID=47856 RepID=A0ABP8SAG5_9ACTN